MWVKVEACDSGRIIRENNGEYLRKYAVKLFIFNNLRHLNRCGNQFENATPDGELKWQKWKEINSIYTEGKYAISEGGVWCRVVECV